MKPGAILLGVVEEDGLVAYLDELVMVTPAFAQQASEGRSAEQRFRFSSPCIKGGCQKWSDQNQHCGLIEDLTVLAGPRELSLPDCAIRKSCRWYSQQGTSACAICPEVTWDPGHA